MITFEARAINLAALNTATKYPSIPTFHTLDPTNGRLAEPAIDFGVGAEVIGTEKIDGTNARIILSPDGGFFLGSREELLYFRGELIGNPALGIVDALGPVAEGLRGRVEVEAVVVFFLELLGGKATAGSKEYTGERRVGWRLFDIARIDGWSDVLSWEPARVSAWRDGGGQRFTPYPALEVEAEELGLALAPLLFREEATVLPRTVEEGERFLTDRIARTGVALDDAAGGRAEGIVVRSADRATIAKMRFEDYRRTLRQRGGERRRGS